MRRITRHFLAACLLLMAGTQLWAQNGAGHWVLSHNKVFIEGKKSKGDDTGWREYRSGELNGYITRSGGKEQHALSVTWTQPPKYLNVGEENKISLTVKGLWDGGAFDVRQHGENPANNALGGMSEGFRAEIGVYPGVAYSLLGVDCNYSMVLANLKAAKTVDEAEKSVLSPLFDNPSDELIKKAQAAKAQGFDLDEFMDSLWDPEYWEDSKTLSASGKLAYDGKKWKLSGSFPEGSYMMVKFGFTYDETQVFPGGASRRPTGNGFKVWQYWLYQFVPDGEDLEVVVDVKDTPGEEEGGTLPPWVIPTAIGLIGGALVGRAIRKRRKAKGDEGPEDNGPSEEEQPQEEEEEAPSTFKMIIYKEFGNTLTLGDAPRIVGARIEEITAKGQHKERPDLTAKITVEEGAYIKITQVGLTSRYRCAEIKVDEAPSQEPKTGYFYFCYHDVGGGLRSRLVFQIEDGRVQFFQDNLTLPAGYEEIEELPVVLYGVSADTNVEASIDGAYTATVERTEVPGACYIHIKEMDKSKGNAGDYKVYPLTVTATNPNGHQIKGTLPVIRMHMGLVFKADPYVGCYAEPYDSTKHVYKLRKEVNGRFYAPPFNKVLYTLLYWDKTSHKLVHHVPDNKKINIEGYALKEKAESWMKEAVSKFDRNLTEEEFIQKMDLRMEDYSFGEDNVVTSSLYCNSLLFPPSRHKVGLRMTYPFKDPNNPEAQEVLYTAEQEVWLLSQPLRQGSPDELLKMAEEDEKDRKILYRVQDYITGHQLMDRIGPVYRMADILLEGYDYHFGFYPPLYKQVLDTWMDYISGKTLGANADPEPVQDLGLFTEVFLALTKAGLQAEEWMDTHLGFFGRLAVGCLTGFWTEVAFSAARVSRAMIETITNPPPKSAGTELEAFIVGVKEVEKLFLFDLAMRGLARVGVKVVLGAGDRIDYNFSNKVFNWVAKSQATLQAKMGIWGMDVGNLVKNQIKSYSARKAVQKTIQQLNAAKAAQQKAARKAEDIILEFRKNSKWKAEEMVEEQLERQANIKAVKKVQEFERSYHDYRRYRTPEFEADFRTRCYEFQGDKLGQKQLELYNSPWGKNLRSEYYRTLKHDYELIDSAAKEYLAADLKAKGIQASPEDIEIFCATNSNEARLVSGDVLTRDRDVNFLLKRKGDKIPVEVPQDMAERAYGRAYKERTGLTLKQGDQAVVQKGSLEMIGSGKEDLERAFKPARFGEKFDDVEGVAKAFEHKPKEWIDEGLELQLKGLQYEGIAKQEEGLRQGYKDYFKSQLPRTTYNGKLDKMPVEFQEAFNVISHIEVKYQGPTSISVSECKKILRDYFNLELKDLPAWIRDVELRSEGAV